VTSQATAAVAEMDAPGGGADRPGWARRHPDVVSAAGLLLLHLGIVLRVRPQPRWGDALLVFRYAREFPDVPLDHHALRVGTIIPARLLQLIFGPGQVAFYGWPLLTGCLLVVATYAVARQLFGSMAGLLAGALVTLSPVLVLSFNDSEAVRSAAYFWQLLPDMPSAALFTGGIALLIAGARSADGQRRVVGNGTLLLLGAGVLFGWAYLVREFIAFMYLTLPVAVLILRLPWRRWWAVAGPMAACLGLELVLAAVAHGDPLARFKVSEGHTGVPAEPATVASALSGFGRAIRTAPRGTTTLVLLVVLIIVAALTRQAALLLCLAWILSLWLPLTMLSGLINHNVISFPAQKVRYWIPLLPPLLIGASGALVSIARFARARRPQWSWLQPMAAALVASALAFYAWPAVAETAHGRSDRVWNQIRNYLQAHDAEIDVVRGDARSLQQLSIYRFPPMGSTPAWHALLDAPDPTITGEPKRARPGDGTKVPPRTVYLWTSYGFKTGDPPSPARAWVEVVGDGQVGLFVPANGPLAR
jgi:hypothetical protein